VYLPDSSSSSSPSPHSLYPSETWIEIHHVIEKRAMRMVSVMRRAVTALSYQSEMFAF
jgi:hypothetical protein